MIRRNLLGCCMCAGLAMLVACGGGDESQTYPASFETITVKTQDLVVPFEYSATLVGKNDVSITPQCTGQLMKVCVIEGQRVSAGTVLFVIDQRDAQLAVETAAANLTAAHAAVKTAQLEYDSNKNLHAQNIVSDYVVNSALNNLNQAKAAEAQARAAVDRAKVNLGYCTITSPVSGIVGTLPVNPGDQVSPGVLLTTVSGTAEMKAKFSITENELNNLANASGNETFDQRMAKLNAVKLKLKDGSEYPIEGRITSYAGAIDRATGSVTCIATFPNPDGKLFSGAQGTVVYPYKASNVIVVPTSSIVRLQDKTLVYKVGADSCATSAIITYEDAGNGKDVVVTSGLKPGDRIVGTGANNVREKQQVIFPSSPANK